MPALRQPVQDRSRRTLEALLEATEALLADRRFEEISVAEIVLKAGASTGSFYARFASKEALLPALYARYHAELPQRLRRIAATVDLPRLSLAEACRRVVREFAATFEGRLNLMRAIVLYARTRTDELQPLMAERAAVHGQLIDMFRPFHNAIRHPDPEAAIRAGLFLVGTTVREAVLFPDAPMAALTRLPLDRLEHMLADILHAYLATPPEGDTA
ncbi:MAG TPA: helix-turn-helix domain-containing protein [Allosphingosinicella sp.]|jgi:AcrR family transcriptional regulator